MGANHVLSFRLLCLAQRASLVFFALGALLFAAGHWASLEAGLSAGSVICAAGVVLYGGLAMLQMLSERRQLFVACPICGARSAPAAWTTAFQCDCPRCSRVYASGIFFLRFFSARHVSVQPASNDSA